MRASKRDIYTYITIVRENIYRDGKRFGFGRSPWPLTARCWGGIRV